MASAYVWLSVWRVLRPNDDWPLALCDYRTVDVEKDVRDTDALRIDRAEELSLLHYNKNHRWYYIPDQKPDCVIVFRNADAEDKRARMC